MVKIEFKFSGVEFFGYIKDLSPDLLEPIKAIQMKQYYEISTDKEKERLFN